MSAESPSCEASPSAGPERRPRRRRGRWRSNADDEVVGEPAHASDGRRQHGLRRAVRLFLSGAADDLHRAHAAKIPSIRKKTDDGRLLEAAVAPPIFSRISTIAGFSSLTWSTTDASDVDSMPVSSPPIVQPRIDAPGQPPDESDRASTATRSRLGAPAPLGNEALAEIPHRLERDARRRRATSPNARAQHDGPQIVVGERRACSRPSRTARATSATSSPSAADRRSGCRGVADAGDQEGDRRGPTPRASSRRATCA